jgi:PTH1 family peptidyl-tRNA hydrolase
MEKAYLIVGLGNPGSEYAVTRHNAGFLAVETVARRWRADWAVEGKFKCRLCKSNRASSRVWLCEPLTYMNLSGEAVGKVRDYFQIPLARLLVVTDDADLPFGEIRMRSQGSSGGHHGLESIEQHLSTREYPRLRIGIGRAPDSAREITGHVLSRFTSRETDRLEKVLDRAARQIECWLDAGIGKAMSQFNGAIEDSGEEKKTIE